MDLLPFLALDHWMCVCVCVYMLKGRFWHERLRTRSFPGWKKLSLGGCEEHSSDSKIYFLTACNCLQLTSFSFFLFFKECVSWKACYFLTSDFIFKEYFLDVQTDVSKYQAYLFLLGCVYFVCDSYLSALEEWKIKVKVEEYVIFGNFF